MLLVAIYNTVISMGSYYARSTYKWVKMAVWDAPIRVYLDVQLEQMRLERNLSNFEEDENHEEWKNISSLWRPTTFESHSVRRHLLFVLTSNDLFGKKYFIVPNLLNPLQHRKNAAFLTLAFRFLYLETCSEVNQSHGEIDQLHDYRDNEWLWWEEISWGTKAKISRTSWKSRSPSYEVQATPVLRNEKRSHHRCFVQDYSVEWQGKNVSLHGWWHHTLIWWVWRVWEAIQEEF